MIKQQLRKKLIILSPLLFLVFSTLAVLSSAQATYAQTQQQATACRTKYHNKTVANDPESRQLLTQYRNSNCDVSKGGNCVSEQSGSGTFTTIKFQCTREPSDPPDGPIDTSPDDPSGSPTDSGWTTNSGGTCAGADTSVIKNCSGSGEGAFIGLIVTIVNFLAAGVAIVVVGGIVFGGITYSQANGNAAKAQQGVTFIVNSVIGLLLFIFMYAILNFIVPGGLLS